jgi:hypothetical protein
MIGCMCWFSAKLSAAFASSAFARPIREKEQNMVSRLPVINANGEVGDLSGIDPALFKPFSALPASFVDGGRNPRKSGAEG